MALLRRVHVAGVIIIIICICVACGIEKADLRKRKPNFNLANRQSIDAIGNYCKRMHDIVTGKQIGRAHV